LDPSRPIGPWISILVRNKLVDTLRRRGRTVYVPIDDVIDTLGFEQIETGLDLFDISRLLGRLSERQRDIVRSISIEGASVRETALRLRLSEGAVRTALHRALARLAALYQNDLA
jgi:RNA polymerase sigma-70 factor (ECF subfamily)